MNHDQPAARGPRGKRQPLVSRRGLVGGGAATLGIAAIGTSLRPWAAPAEAQGTTLHAAADDIAAAETVENGNVFVEPIVRQSSGGVLDTSLIAQPDLNAPPGRMNYDGQLPGPTLIAQPGDTLRIFLANSLGGQITNLHTHGLHVSPSGNSDNVFIHIEPGDSFQYEIAIPDDHPVGLYWYHPHHHGNSMQQVAGGLAGAIIIDTPDHELIPGLDDVRHRLMVLQGPFLDDDGSHYLVNGVENPVLAMQPGERQFWRVLNANANGYYLLTLSGHDLIVVEEDGNPVVAPQTMNSLLLGPGERVGLLIDAATDPAEYQLRSLAWGEDAQEQDEFLVATAVVVDGDPLEPGPLPETVFDWPDLAEATVDRQRTIVFEMNNADPFFAIDGKAFDPDVVDYVVQLGAVEEWVIQNASDEWHPFHIHVNDFQVMSVNGEPVPVNRNDTFSLPPNGEIVVRIPFYDFTGKFVFHCHILAHEDFGMMAVVEVVGAAQNGLSVAASGLASPRDMAWDSNGTMYVVQSGTGETETSIGTAAAVVKIENGCPVEFASGLPSSADPFRDVLGPSGIAFLDDTLYVLQTATGLYADMDPGRPNGIYAVESTGTFRLVADLTTWIRDNPVTFTPGDANELGEPFRFLAADGGFWVLESNRGEVLWVTVDGEVTRIADLSVGHPVLTGFALAPQGGVYVGDLTPAPHEDGSAKIVHVAEDGTVSDVWTNLTTVVGILVDEAGTLYALEMATDNDNGMRAGTGKLVRQTGADESQDVVTGLDYPIGLRFGPDGAFYIAFPAYGDNDVSGAVLRFELGAEEPVALDPSLVVAALCPGAVPYMPPAPSAVGTPVAPPDHAHDDAPAGTPSAEMAITIENFAYDPATANVSVGARVTWTNDDALAHTATANDGTFDSGNIPAGGSYSFTFDTAGTYAYTCTYHPQMTGTIVVS